MLRCIESVQFAALAEFRRNGAIALGAEVERPAAVGAGVQVLRNAAH